MELNKRQIIPPGFNLTSNVYKLNDKFFILIPKNASNSILFGTNYSAEIKSKESIEKEKPRINVFIREPISRFQASLIESLKRSSIFYYKNSIANFSSVPVSPEIKFIYQNFLKDLKNDPFLSISNILDVINCSFFDPHLCPQWYFFTSLDCLTISNLSIYLLSDLNTVMSNLNLDIKRNYNINSSFDTESQKKFDIYQIKPILKKLIVKIDKILIEKYKSLNKFGNNSIIMRDPTFQLIAYDDWLSASEIIKDTIKSSTEIKDKILKLYDLDSKIYNQLLKKSNININYQTDIYSVL